MIISLKSNYEKLNEVFEIPFFGGIIIFVLAAFPVPLLFILNGIFEFADIAYIERINALITGIWNCFLCFIMKIEIGIFIIPCWILFTVIGVLRWFQIIG